jgi:ACS family glucarate transporter-like MFS transporter
VHPPTHVRYVVVAALCVAAAVAYIQRNSYAGAETIIVKDLDLKPDQTGYAAGLLFFPYALLQAPAGWLAQRTGPRWTLVGCAIGWSVALGLCSLADGPYPLIGGRLLMGAFQAGLLPCATLIVAAWLPPARRGLGSGLLNSFMLIGAALNANFTGFLIEPLGWRGLFLAYAIPGLIWAFLFAVWFRNRPANHPGVNDAELAIIRQGRDDAGPTASVRRTSWIALLTSGALYCICLQQFNRAGANRFSDQWLTTYLQKARHVALADANQLTSLPQWAGVLGGFVGGLLSDYLLARTGSRRVARKGLACTSLIGALALYGVSYLISDPMLATLTFSAGMFVFFFSGVCAYAITMDMGGRNVGVIFGLMNMAGNLGAGAFTALVPQLNAWYGGGWTPTLVVFAAMHVVALLCWLPLDPNGTIGEPLDGRAGGVSPLIIRQVGGNVESSGGSRPPLAGESASISAPDD